MNMETMDSRIGAAWTTLNESEFAREARQRRDRDAQEIAALVRVLMERDSACLGVGEFHQRVENAAKNARFRSEVAGMLARFVQKTRDDVEENANQVKRRTRLGVFSRELVDALRDAEARWTEIAHKRREAARLLSEATDAVFGENAALIAYGGTMRTLERATSEISGASDQEAEAMAQIAAIMRDAGILNAE